MGKKNDKWEILKSGARKGPNGWTAALYSTGWYFTHFEVVVGEKDSTISDRYLGPFKTFEIGLEKYSN